MTPEQRFVAAALKHLGVPYLWQGKGYVKWTLAGLATHGFADGSGTHPLYLVDCSGLVTCAIKEAGGPDWRGSHRAQTLLEACEREYAPGGFATLHFYGASRSAISHVNICLDNGMLLGAMGGDSTTTKPTPGKDVRLIVGDNRSDFQEAGRLPLGALLK